MARLVQYGTVPLQNIGFLKGTHPIAAELEDNWHNGRLSSTGLTRVRSISTSDVYPIGISLFRFALPSTRAQTPISKMKAVRVELDLYLYNSICIHYDISG